MADFKKVLKTAERGYHFRPDYPPFAPVPWEDRPRWTAYLSKINDELDAKEDADTKRSAP